MIRILILSLFSSQRPMRVWQKMLLVFSLLAFSICLYLLSATTIVLNGTRSLPHNGYFMVTWPRIVLSGSYVAFESPSAISESFENLIFVKRVVGVSGDIVLSAGRTVCINQVCRDLLPQMVENGYGPVPSQTIPYEHIAVFGDAENSFDSRYDVVGTISRSQIRAVGFPIPVPHWKEIGRWLGTF